MPTLILPTLTRIVLLLAAVACASPAPSDSPKGETPDSDVHDDTIDDTTDDTTDDTDATNATDMASLALPATGRITNDHFATGRVCSDCHANLPSATAMRDEVGEGIAPYDLWQASMMANAGRDPYWRATVSAELAATPGAAGHVAETCTRCHLPMASEDARLSGDPAIGLDVLQADSPRGHLARDGVSCSLCHQIEPEGLGAPSSFTGGYVTAGAQVEYGPHASPFTRPMQMHTGFTPTQGAHVRDSELCATCHQLVVHTLDASGAATGQSVTEQGPYAEWLGSDAAASGVSCADCHLPTTSDAGLPIETRIARTPQGDGFPISDRSPFGRHLMVGGNTWIPQLLRDHADVLSPVADAAAFDAVVTRARDSLARAATVTVSDTSLAGDHLRADLAVSTLLGHKLPTAYPSRRAWLEIVVRDATGAEVLHVGATDTHGRLLGPDGAPLPSEQVAGPLEPHRTTVSSADDLVVYESILAAPDGSPTFRLVRAAGYVKDTRLLPPGLTPAEAASADVPVVGAEGDADFGAGGDHVRLDVPTSGHAGPFTVDATLRYQPIGHRWLAELLAVDTPETRAFAAMIDALDRSPETLAHAAATVP